MNPDTLQTALLIILGVAAGLDELHRIKFKYNHNTPLGVVIGSSLFAGGCFGCFLHPIFCLTLILLGRFLYTHFNRRDREKKSCGSTNNPAGN